MKKLFVLSFLPLLLLASCGKDSQYQKYFSKTYTHKGSGNIIIFHEEYVTYSDMNSRCLCMYDTQKLYNVSSASDYTSEVAQLEINYEKEYDQVFIQGADSRYTLLGFFYDIETFVTVTDNYYLKSLSAVYSTKNTRT